MHYLLFFISSYAAANDTDLNNLERKLGKTFEEKSKTKFRTLLDANNLFQKKKPRKSNDCGQVLAQAIVNGEKTKVEHLVKGGCGLNNLALIPDQEESCYLSDTDTTDNTIWMQKACTPLWAAIFLCEGDTCEDIIHFLSNYGAQSQAAIKIKKTQTKYPSEGDACYGTGGTYRTCWKGHRLLEEPPISPDQSLTNK